MKRLRIIDINTPWFWITCFWQRTYGKPRLELALWEPHKWQRWWVNFWQWEGIPDENMGAWAKGTE